MRSFALPLPDAGSGVSGLPLERRRANRLRVSNQNGAPSEIARIVKAQPLSAIAIWPAPWGTASPRQPIGMPTLTTRSTSSATLLRSLAAWPGVGVAFVDGVGVGVAFAVARDTTAARTVSSFHIRSPIFNVLALIAGTRTMPI